MSPIQAILAYVVGPAIITIGTVIAAKFAQRAAEGAAETTAEVSEKTSAVDGYHQLVADLRVDFTRLREDHDRLTIDHQELKGHVLELERKAQQDKNLIRRLIAYINALRDEIRRLNGRVPEPPVEFVEHVATHSSY